MELGICRERWTVSKIQCDCFRLTYLPEDGAGAGGNNNSRDQRWAVRRGLSEEETFKWKPKGRKGAGRTATGAAFPA